MKENKLLTSSFTIFLLFLLIKFYFFAIVIGAIYNIFNYNCANCFKCIEYIQLKKKYIKLILSLSAKLHGILVIYSASSCAYELEETHLDLDNASNVSSTIDDSSGCQCSTYSCGCCEKVNIHFLVTGLVCTNFSVLPNDYGISFTITFNNYTVINETFSARNPPPMCIGIPELEKINAEICLRLYNLEFKNRHFSGCVDVKVAVYHIIHKSVTVGCFHLPPDTINIIPQFKRAIDRLTMKKNIYKDNFEMELKEIMNMPTVQKI